MSVRFQGLGVDGVIAEMFPVHIAEKMTASNALSLASELYSRAVDVQGLGHLLV